MLPVASSIRKDADLNKMKFLILTFCVCAASAASFGAYKPWQPQQQVTQAVAQVVQTPDAQESKTYVPKSYVAKPVAPAPVVSIVPKPSRASYTPVSPVAKAGYSGKAKPVAPVVTNVPNPSRASYTPVSPVAKAGYSGKAKPVAPVVSNVPKPSKASYTPDAPVSKAVYSGNDRESAVLRADSEINDNGFNYFYETSNGISAQSTGTLKRVDDSDVIAIQGSYRYTAPDGTPVVFTYIADENGYHPESDSIPVGPAIPEAIARSLEYLRTHPPKEQY